MKKIFKITGTGILIVLAALAILPFAFKGKILETVKKEVNKSVNAKVDFQDFGLNFFRSFPHVSISLNDVTVVGIDEFDGDTLLAVKQLAATINVASIFGDTGYELTKIVIDRAQLNAIVLENGHANWDILPASETDTVAEPSAFRLSLKKLQINNTSLSYDDATTAMHLDVDNLNLTLSGDMTADETRIQTQFVIDRLSYFADKIPYLYKATLKGKMDIDADLKNSKFTLADNLLQLNAIQAEIDGWVSLPDEETIDTDLRLNVPDIQFKDILSLIPAIYAKDFKDLKTSGEVSLTAFAKGSMKGDNLPAFDVQLKIANAMFQYPGMPKSVSNINTDIHASNAGGDADKTVVDISHFHFEMADNPFDFKLIMKTPISDPDINFSAVGKLNLNSVKEIYPLENTHLSGQLDADLSLAARMSAIEKQKFDQIQATGSLNISNMLIQTDNMKDLQLHRARLGFSPRSVELTGLSAQIGNNDLAADGKLENFIPYILKGETLKGALSVMSNHLNLNDFMSDETTAESDTSAISIIEVPENLNFTLNVQLKHLIFDNLEMDNVVGQVLVNHGKIDMKNLSMNALGGTMKVNGAYDTHENPKKPAVALNVDIKEVSFGKTFATFVTIRKFAPIFENLTGNYSTQLQLNSTLGDDFMPDLATLTAAGLLQSNQVSISNVGVLDKLAETVKNESLKNMHLKDLKLPFSISDGRVTTKPFAVNFGDGTMNLEGSTGLDQTINYAGKINLAGQLANSYVNNVNLKIGGTFTQPKISIDTKSLVQEAISNTAASLIQENTTIDEDLMLKATAAGEKLIEEAEKQGQKLIDEAQKTSNPIAKAAAVKAAEAAAKKLKDEAKKQANQLTTEAEKEMNKLKQN